MNTRSISSLSKILLLAAIIVGGSAQGGSGKYIAFFSAEQEHYRRILIDGVGNRHVNVELDSLGQCEIRIWGASEKSYVGLRNYTKGYLIPVHIKVEFPEKQLMLIKVYGTRFKEVVKFREVGSGLYVIDLYVRRLPQESIFREETISALWPGGRFQPDVIPGGGATVQLAAAHKISFIPPVLAKLAPYRYVIYRAMFWAAAVFAGLFITGIPLIILMRRRRTHRLFGSRQGKGADRLDIADAAAVRAQNMMKHNGDLSFEEATLMADLEKDPAGRS
ncbi:MAG: hypothetical protein IH972_00105 [Candidatus Marinimicrobia bacterium]|nr:hypothetical protein [Candidatus Neomarinimicrobiota bacterium]